MSAVAVMKFTERESRDAGMRLLRHLGVDPMTVSGDHAIEVESISDDEVIVRWASLAVMPAADFAAIMSADVTDS